MSFDKPESFLNKAGKVLTHPVTAMATGLSIAALRMADPAAALDQRPETVQNQSTEKIEMVDTKEQSASTKAWLEKLANPANLLTLMEISQEDFSALKKEAPQAIYEMRPGDNDSGTFAYVDKTDPNYQNLRLPKQIQNFELVYDPYSLGILSNPQTDFSFAAAMENPDNQELLSKSLPGTIFVGLIMVDGKNKFVFIGKERQHDSD